MPYQSELRYLRFLRIESETCKAAIAEGNEESSYRLARMLGSAVLARARQARAYGKALRTFVERVNLTRKVTQPKLSADKIESIKRCWYCDGQIRSERVYPQKGQIAYEMRCRKCKRPA